MAPQRESLIPENLDLPPTCSSPLSNILDREIRPTGLGPHPSRDILPVLLILQLLPPGMTFLILLAYTYVFQNSAPVPLLQNPLFLQGMTPFFFFLSSAPRRVGGTELSRSVLQDLGSAAGRGLPPGGARTPRRFTMSTRWRFLPPLAPTRSGSRPADPPRLIGRRTAKLFALS